MTDPDLGPTPHNRVLPVPSITSSYNRLVNPSVPVSRVPGRRMAFDSGSFSSNDSCVRPGPEMPVFHSSSGGQSFSSLGMGTPCNTSEAIAMNVDSSISQPVNQPASETWSISACGPGGTEASPPNDSGQTGRLSWQTSGPSISACGTEEIVSNASSQSANQPASQLAGPTATTSISACSTGGAESIDLPINQSINQSINQLRLSQSIKQVSQRPSHRPS